MNSDKYISDYKPAPIASNENQRLEAVKRTGAMYLDCLLYTSPSPRDGCRSRMPSSA